MPADPGNLPARMAEVIGSHEWDGFPRSAHNQHNYYGACAVCQRDVPRMAEVALGVRDELVAHLSARAAVAEARVGHAEASAELSSERLAKVRQELAEAKAANEARQAHTAHVMDLLNGTRELVERAEAERDRLRLAWQSARERAKAYGNSIERLCEEREWCVKWYEQAEAQAAALQRELAKACDMTAQYSQKAIENGQRANEAERKLHEIAMVKVWTNEDGKRFVFADDLAGILLDTPAEGTTTPARETA